MSRGKSLFNKIYSITILIMLFMTGLAGIQAMAATESDERKVHWESSTKDEEIKAPDGLTGDGGKWESPTFASSDNGSNDKDIATKPMTAANEYAAIAAALAGVLAISASKKSTNEGLPTVSEGNGIWVPETDRDAVINMINKAASKEYYIDANGFVKEVPGTVENLNKSSTYSSVLDRLIAGENKVVIGVGDGWVSSGEAGLEANAFTGKNSGITVGDNGTPQVVIVSGKDMPESTADMTLAHELTHALRGEEGIRSINTTVGINKDEEAHVIEVENKIRSELGYVVRKDGDTSDGGDGSYGKYGDSLEKDWYNKIDQLQKSRTLSNNPYSNWYSIPAPGSNFSPAHPDAPHITVYDEDEIADQITDEIMGEMESENTSDHRHHNRDHEWGSDYDDSIWRKTIKSIVSNAISSMDGWNNERKPNRDWKVFWNSEEDNSDKITKIKDAVSSHTDKILKVISSSGGTIKGGSSGIESVTQRALYHLFNNIQYKKFTYVAETMLSPVVSNSTDNNAYDKDEEIKVLNPLNTVEENEEQSASGYWREDKDHGDWYHYNSNGEKDTGWIKDKGEWYYLFSNGTMAANYWLKNQDGDWYHFDSIGKMETNQYIMDSKRLIKYYVDSDGKWDGQEVSTDYNKNQSSEATSDNQGESDAEVNESFDLDNLEKVYFAHEAKSLPPKVTRHLGEYTYIYELQEHGIPVPFSTELDYGYEITLSDGIVASTKRYSYNLVYTDAPKNQIPEVSQGIVFISPSKGPGKAELGEVTGYVFKEGIDVDLRGTGKTYIDALEDAFSKTGTTKSDFQVTKWGKDSNGKSFPVEWRASNGAEVNVDIGHTTNGPDVSHIGYQTGGKRGSGGAVRGHILVDDVPINR